MNQEKCLVLDANILLRAVLGVRVFALLESYEETTSFRSPAYCFAEARRHLPGIAAKRRIDNDVLFGTLDKIALLVGAIEASLYNEHRQAALARLPRDPDDWPVAATALLLNGPIWTEDQDFFGCGIATWTTSTVEICLRES